MQKHETIVVPWKNGAEFYLTLVEKVRYPKTGSEHFSN